MVVDFPKRAVHGGTGKLHQEKTNKMVLDFSASVNPCTPRFTWTLDPARLSAYPDDTYFSLKERIGQVFHRDPQEICVGNGSVELIRAFCAVVFRPGMHRHRFYQDTPTFSEYALSAELAGAVPALSRAEADVTFLCNPNSPTGQLLPRETVTGILQETVHQGGILFCDEAFIELADPAQSVTDIRDPGLFVVRSLTKCFSVPGIRFGYGFGDPILIEKIETARAPWSVNAYAEAYAMEALLHMDALEDSRAYISTERSRLVTAVRDLGLHCTPSQANYILVNCKRPATPLCEQMAARGILVRDCTSFGLPQSIRIAVRLHEENSQLIDELAACVR